MIKRYCSCNTVLDASLAWELTIKWTVKKQDLEKAT